MYFDGRNDRTIVQNKLDDGKFHRQTITEEHVSIVLEPGSSYFTHVSPTNGASESIARAIIKCLETKYVDMVQIQAIGCDGTVVNTGVKKGVIRLLETSLNRPLQCFVRQLHTNELLLPHLFVHIDGATSRPQVKIEVELPVIDSEELSSDQKYLYDIFGAVINGHCSLDLSLRNLGAINHARWLRTGNRILRIYIGSENPIFELVTLATFVIRVYAPMRFCIKGHSSCDNGARHLFSTILKSRYLPKNLLTVIDTIIQQNGYFGHSENLLLSMLMDVRPNIRELGLRQIIKARKLPSVRVFKVPSLNLSAKDHIELIDWHATGTINEPPLTFGISEEEMLQFIKQKETPSVTFPCLLCYTEAVERCVKMVTEASEAVCGANRRNGYIKVQLESRRLMSFFHNKRDYVL